MPLGNKKKLKLKLWVGISLIVIGSLIIVAGIVGYYIEEENCPPVGSCGFLHYWGGIGLFGLTFLGLVFILPGIINSFRKRISWWVYCILIVILLPGMAYFLTFFIENACHH